MGYTCSVCNKSFSRCAYIIHTTEKNCSSNLQQQFQTTNQVSLNSLSSDHNVQPHSSSKLEKVQDGTLEVLENGSMFMVVRLDEEKSPNEDLNAANDSSELFELTLPNLEDNFIQGILNDENNFTDINDPIEVDGTDENINTENIRASDEVPLPGQNDAPKGLTKLGNPRKRAAPKQKDELKTKRERNKEKHELQPPCHENCKRKCTQKITEERRLTIYEKFWSMEEKERKLFVLGHVDKSKVQRKTSNEEHSKRGKTFFYNLKNSEGERTLVCKTFFLSTLGYKKKNDMFVFNVLNKSVDAISPQPDKRGRHPPHNLIDKAVIKEHILKYNPCISHYRREHAPNRKYLPIELSVVQMHKDFLKEHEGTNIQCSYELYRGVVSKMNISFTKLGHEECEKCTKYTFHNPEHVKNNDQSCGQCNEWLVHKEKYKEARKAYDNYIDLNRLQEYNQMGTVVCSMDLQKVIMLPYMEQFKEAVFTRRIVLFNESFVPLGNKQNIEPVACIWHEGISGRRKEDITSALNAFIMHYRDAKEIHIWMDNCASQNKNWALFSYLVGLINSAEIGAEKIVLNYLEPGHTFMSADHFHHQVNQQVKFKGKIYDFADFEDAVKRSNSGKVNVKSLQHNDFFTTFDYSSQYKITNKVPRPYLSEMVQVIFQRDSFDLHYKSSFNGVLQSLSFLKAGYLKKKEVPKPKRRLIARGVNTVKKVDILQKLVPLMPQNRHAFWVNLPTSEEPDLTTQLDVVE